MPEKRAGGCCCCSCRGSHSATCEFVSGIVCPKTCARAKSRLERSSRARSTPSVMRETAIGTNYCFGFQTSYVQHLDAMGSSDEFYGAMETDAVACFDTTDNLNTAIASADETLTTSSSSSLSSSSRPITAFTTTGSETLPCRNRLCSSSNSSLESSFSSPSLSPASSTVSLSTCDHCLDERMNVHTCSTISSCRRTRTNGSRSTWCAPHGLTTGLVLLLVVAFLSGPTLATMDITAFEYQRKFHKPLNLGECPQREVAVDMGNNTFFIEEQRCSLEQKGTVTHLPRELNDSRNVHITSAGDIVAYLGLCGGEAASFLGILNSGDCVAVEIASQLKFDKKTLIRAFVGYYRKSLDILDSNTDNQVMAGRTSYLKDKFYLKNRSYGTLEIIFVQFRFRKATDKDRAEELKLTTPVMSEYMKAIAQQIGIPRNILVINLSTATQETYELKHFKDEEWERAVRHVEILELTIQMTRDRINSNAISPHLQYQLFPFIDAGDGAYRLSNPIIWEKTSMLEVQLRQDITLAKKTSRKCRRNKTKLCQRVRELRRQLISAHAEIHKGRSNWVSLTPEEKNAFATRYTARIKSYSRFIKSLAKDVRQMKKQEKLERLNRKRNRLNQIPVHNEEKIEKRQRRLRHARSRSRRRNRRNKVRNG